MKSYTGAIKKFWRTSIDNGDAERIKSQTKPAGITEKDDIPYIDDGDTYHLLDVYYPEGSEDKKLPCIMDIHGGGWMYGTKIINKYYCMVLASRGYTVININYRLSPEATIKDQIDDCFAAMRFLMNNYKDYPIDIDKLYLTGDSAGGHLTLLTMGIMNNPKYRTLCKMDDIEIPVKAVCLTSPVCDMNDKNYAFKACIDGSVSAAKYPLEVYKYLNFSDIFTGNYPPAFITQAKIDLVKGETKKIRRMFDEAHVEYEFYECPIAKYGDELLAHTYYVTDPFIEPCVDVIDKMLDFFARH